MFRRLLLSRCQLHATNINRLCVFLCIAGTMGEVMLEQVTTMLTAPQTVAIMTLAPAGTLHFTKYEQALQPCTSVLPPYDRVDGLRHLAAFEQSS